MIKPEKIAAIPAKTGKDALKDFGNQFARTGLHIVNSKLIMRPIAAALRNSTDWVSERQGGSFKSRSRSATCFSASAREAATACTFLD